LEKNVTIEVIVTKSLKIWKQTSSNVNWDFKSSFNSIFRSKDSNFKSIWELNINFKISISLVIEKEEEMINKLKCYCPWFGILSSMNFWILKISVAQQVSILKKINVRFQFGSNKKRKKKNTFEEFLNFVDQYQKSNE